MSEFDELPETFDPSTHEGTRDFEPFPPGWYQAQMIESSVEQARNGNGTYLLAVFEILSGDHRGRRIYQRRGYGTDARYPGDAVQAGHGACRHQAG
jgi:hypothetical protein